MPIDTENPRRLALPPHDQGSGMQIRLDQARDEPFRFDERVVVGAEVVDNPDLVALGPVHWRGELRFVDPGFLLSATYDYEQTLTCQRCLEPSSGQVSGEMQLLFLPSAEPTVEEELELAEEDLGVIEVAGDDPVVELDPLLAEQLQLNVPMKPLCSPECGGLCPECGEPRDRGGCECSREAGDPRWGALADLKARLEGN